MIHWFSITRQWDVPSVTGRKHWQKITTKKKHDLKWIISVELMLGTSATRDDPISLLSIPGPETISEEMGN